eukprot:171699-Alexandrium_andersonii.AAC.1
MLSEQDGRENESSHALHVLDELEHSEQEPQMEFNLFRASCAGLGDPLDTCVRLAGVVATARRA